jgi:hypothetical protein
MNHLGSLESFKNDKEAIQTILEKESLRQLDNVQGSIVLPKSVTVDGKVIQYTKRDVELFTQKICSDIFWWPIVFENKLVGSDLDLRLDHSTTIDQLWNQNGIILPFMGFSHSIYVLEDTSNNKCKSVQKTVAIPREDSKIPLSYIAEYIVEETEDSFVFTLDANLEGLPKWISGSVIQSITSLFLSTTIKPFFETGDVKRLVDVEIPSYINNRKVERKDLPLGYVYGVIGRAWLQKVKNIFGQ